MLLKSNLICILTISGMSTLRGFVEQPQAASRQAFAPLFSFLPSFNEVQQRPIVAIDVSIGKNSSLLTLR